MNSSLSQAAWSSWTLPFWPTLGLLAAASLYLRGFRLIRRTRLEMFAVWRACCFLGGLVSIWLALASPLDTLDGLLLTAHMVQHLILMSVAPPLLLLGMPVVPLLRGLPRPLLRDGLGPFVRWPLLHRVVRVLTHPAFAWLAMNISYLGWHTPVAYDFALRHAGWHEVEHVCFLLTSLLFWYPVVQPWPARAQGSRWIMLPYLVGADLVNTALSAFLSFAGRVVYPSYLAQPRIFGVSALSDQATAGALMWVLGSIFFLVPLMAIAAHLLSPRSQRMVPFKIVKPAPRVMISRLPTRLDLLRLPVIGTLLRARYGRMALQSIAFAIALAVIIAGFRGPQAGDLNLAGVVPWTYVRVAGVIGLLVLGNLFCLSCPFMLPRELGARLGLARLTWPRRLRNKWTGLALMAAFFWSYEAFDLWDHPMRTAWLLLAYFAAAFAVDTVFRGANFCKYVCPLGQFNFTLSLLSPFTLEARHQSTCGQCSTRDCIAGNQQQRGCELQLYMPLKAGNMDCTLCMDCVKACPHDNIGLFPVAPVRDLLHEPARSSIGKLASRPDIAALVLLVVISSFANAAAMVTPQPLLAAAGAAVMAVVVIVALLGTGKWLSLQGARPVREMACRLAQAMLPLGAAMWAAHLIFHLLTSGGWFMVTPDNRLSLQLLLLDAGLLLTLYLGWRMAISWTTRTTHAAINTAFALLPWFVIVGAAWAAGIWILLQPMQMRAALHA